MKDINIREIKDDDFRKGILSGEILPHDAEIKVKFKNGKEVFANVKWNVISSLYEHHNKNAVGECYELLIESNL